MRMHAAAVICTACLIAVPATAQRYPAKPIKMVIGYAPGGGTDIMGRLIAQQITEATGQQVIVENRAGAAQNVAAEYFIRQPADGYNLFMSSAALGVNVSLYPKLNYDPVKDFVPVALFATSPNLLLVHPSNPANHGGRRPAGLRHRDLVWCAVSGRYARGNR